VLTENVAILTYLARSFPHAELLEEPISMASSARTGARRANQGCQIMGYSHCGGVLRACRGPISPAPRAGRGRLASDNMLSCRFPQAPRQSFDYYLPLPWA
jgi:glutathione S-transferase